MAWPPPKVPLGAIVAAAMTPHDHRFSADWAVGRREEARQAESRRVYEASLRR
jgi:hypothetical protein